MDLWKFSHLYIYIIWTNLRHFFWSLNKADEVHFWVITFSLFLWFSKIMASKYSKTFPSIQWSQKLQKNLTLRLSKVVFLQVCLYFHLETLPLCFFIIFFNKTISLHCAYPDLQNYLTLSLHIIGSLKFPLCPSFNLFHGTLNMIKFISYNITMEFQLPSLCRITGKQSSIMNICLN